MNKFILTTVLLITPLLGYASISREETKDKMAAELDTIKSTFAVMYAPAEWKKEYTNWDLDEQMNLAKITIQEATDITLKKFQRTLLGFFNSMKDYHVGVSFYSTEAAFLPFRVHSTNGKYYVAWVYSSLFAELKSPLNNGDEVLFFNGRPVDDVVQEVKNSEFSKPFSDTDQALAEFILTMRQGFWGNIVPTGPVTVTVRHTGTNQVTTYNMSWYYFEEEISSSLSPLLAAAESKLLSFDGSHYHLTNSLKKKPLGEHPFFYKDMTTPIYKNYKMALFRRGQAFHKKKKPTTFMETDEDDEEDRFIGSEKSFIPTLGEVVWNVAEGNPFHAYIYLNDEGKRIGYVRIPHYGAGSHSAEKFAEIIKTFEEQTDALVVDQVSNPGGNLFYMYALASMLSDKPLVVPTHRMTITQEEVFFAIEHLHELEEVENDEDARDLIGSNMAGYPVDFSLAQKMEKFFQFVIDEWNEDRTFTNPEYLFGIDFLKPHPKGHYSKPILLLVNQLDFSCGDFLPAILQDNSRVTILGTNTAGAGGYVLWHTYPNLFGVNGFSFTGSIAQRIDQKPIENLGVVPDILVEMTERDLEENYQDYTSQIHQAVLKLLAE